MKEQTKISSFEGLSLVEIEEINAEISEYEDKMAVSTEALKIIQKHVAGFPTNASLPWPSYWTYRRHAWKRWRLSIT